MSVLSMADGQSHNCPIEYVTLRGILFESRNTSGVAGVTYGPGNPPAWIELPIDGGSITVTRSNVVAIRP